MLLLACCAWAQAPADTFSVMIYADAAGFTESDTRLRQACLDRLALLGYQTGEHGQYQLWIRSAPLPGQNDRIAVSYTCYSALPRPVLQFNKEQQVFYKAVNSEKEKDLPAEARMVREYVSDEFMRCYLAPFKMDLLFTDRADVNTAGARMVDDLLGQTVKCTGQNRH